MVLHNGVIPADGLVLSDIKMVVGWPNPVLEASRAQGSPVEWLQTVDNLALSNNRPDFNMGLYQIVGKNFPAAVYGPFETANPVLVARLYDNLRSLPEKYKHLAHLF